ncbi:hypothetical protein CBY09_04835 [Acidovorax kalamii]|uniref:Uncharacterized protein n=1 Tax=Acidovorax kalamii TaxID=2004485 RepID=A0A235EQ28_9BURK|nr:hypothetical protein CBY09_04835 [Acidovorax kalamii]
MPRNTRTRRSGQPPERLRRFPLLSNCCAIREGGRSQRGGAALARLPWCASRPLHGPATRPHQGSSCVGFTAVRDGWI